MNEYGDRAGSDYAIFAPVMVGGKVEWRMVELYDFAKDTIVKVERDPFAERPATLPTALPKFSPPPKPAPATTPTPTPTTPAPLAATPTPTPTPTPTTPAPGVSPALIVAIVVIVIVVAAIAYYLLRR